ncbi:RNA polymerase sigma-70 factor, ECF subfamily [Paenibacillus tianmuensis]|uniref:RNA polymerase sigma-70 factor, ECF subfamily n=1 Tax=Paenibacillus tianmuensis TaxID=624147 RepID=A0A1G4TC71_9BACL|nr:sigma-70 family RNA polymerase sigma factor [Paenibacillus tianmuensis]SCW79033.1 RNA polymerase sigma-70 factor, ECF subfamily [Paenibacillus tianmuensis]
MEPKCDDFELLLKFPFDQLPTLSQKNIYQIYYHSFFRIVFKMVKNNATTEDILQESFYKSILYFPKNLRNLEHLKRWLRVVIRNTTLNYLKKQGRLDKTHIHLDDALYVYDKLSLEQKVEHRLLLEHLNEQLTHLKKEYAYIIFLRWKKELSNKEIAAKLGISEQNVRIKLLRARKAFKKILDFSKIL